MPKQTLLVLPQTFVIHSLPVDASIPASIFQQDVYFIGKTPEEVSLVVSDELEIESEDSDGDWRALEILGPLELSMIGIMAGISSVLAAASISIFVVSTFETDFFLVKQKDLLRVSEVLTDDGYKIQS